jgi:hypothetical protein
MGFVRRAGLGSGGRPRHRPDGGAMVTAGHTAIVTGANHGIGAVSGYR